MEKEAEGREGCGAEVGEKEGTSANRRFREGVSNQVETVGDGDHALEGKRPTVRAEATKRQAIHLILLRTEQLRRQFVSVNRINHPVLSLEIIITLAVPCLIAYTDRFDRSFCSLPAKQDRS